MIGLCYTQRLCGQCSSNSHPTKMITLPFKYNIKSCKEQIIVASELVHRLLLVCKYLKYSQNTHRTDSTDSRCFSFFSGMSVLTLALRARLSWLPVSF